ncbi:phage gene 29 protein family protein [Corynebacterium callunae]|uniref:phage gene 29 protein family protein n=1 Tax=Corynebacterium callunae TaxID=1721 RepID=UPI001FFF5774|nr:DUF2744 domain-containing protein [Corynebacterium callunae]MCK2200174.1 DUF2744 domain-containing protein [Corynebacterium callunae]
MSGIPLQQDCDLSDPEEMFLWMFTALPGMEEQAPMLVPPAWGRKWSKRMFDAGSRFHPEEQTIKYIPPAQGSSILYAGSGRWVPLGEPLTELEATPVIDHLTRFEKRALVKKLQAEGFIPDGAVVDSAEDSAEVGRYGD